MKTEIKNRKRIKKSPTIVISNKVMDYSHDPYVIEKGRQSKIFLEKNGFPEELLKLRGTSILCKQKIK